MAKKPYGAGKSAREILTGISRNLGRVKESTLRAAVGRLSSAMNKRLDRASKTGQDSPAIREVRESGGRFSTRGKTFEGLKAEFIRIKNFFNNPTSTDKGWKRVQREATEKARKAGTIAPPPPSPSEPPGHPQPEEPAGGWVPPEGWTWNEETRSWEHPNYGSGWLPYEEEGGGLYDPITAEIVGNTARSYHDYDAYTDNRRWGPGSETGKLWQMVDSISAMDSRFAKRESYANPAEDPRMRLFDAIDDAWVENPSLTFEEARDLVSKRLDQIYDEAQSHVTAAYSMGFSTFFSDEDDW